MKELEGLVLRQAEYDKDHKTLCALAKKSKYISSFSSIMFSSPEAYAKGWIRLVENGDGTVLGFTCVRHKKRAPETMLYFLMIDPELRRSGLGRMLMDDLEDQTPHPIVTLKVMNDNPGAIAFYRELMYQEVGPCYDGKGIQMSKQVKQIEKTKRRRKKA